MLLGGRFRLGEQFSHAFTLGGHCHLDVDELLQILVCVCPATLRVDALVGGNRVLRFRKLLPDETHAMLDTLVVHPHDHGTFTRGHEKIHGLQRLDNFLRLASVQVVDEDDEGAPD